MTVKIDKSVIESDRFCDMPKTTQLLYFMYLFDADKNGYISHPQSILQVNGFGADDPKILIDKGFIVLDGALYRIADWKRK